MLVAIAAAADPQRRQPLARPPSYDTVSAISFSPDGRTIAIARGSADPFQRFGRIELWNLESGKLLHVIKGFDGAVRSISFSPDGQTLLSGSNEYRTTTIQEKAQSRERSVSSDLKWWDATTGELKQKITLPSKGIQSLRAAYSPDGKQVAIIQSVLEMSFLSSNTLLRGDPSRGLSPNVGFISPHAFFSAELKLLEAQTGVVRLKLNLRSKSPARALFSPDGVLLAAWNVNDVTFWNAQSGREERKLKDFKGQISSIVFSPDGHSLAVASTKYEKKGDVVVPRSEVKVFDVRTWKETATVINLGPVNSVAFGPTGRVLLLGGLIGVKDGVFPGVKLVDLQNGATALLPIGIGVNTDLVDLLVLSRNGAMLALRSGDETVKIVDTRSWQMQHTFDANSIGEEKGQPASRFVLSVRRVLAVAFSTDGNTVAGELEQGEVKFWDHRTGEVKKQLAADEEEPSLVAIAADAGAVAEVSDGTLRVGTANGEAKRILPLPDGGSISTIALSPDGQTLAVGVGAGLKLLRVSSGEVEKSPARRSTVLTRLEFSNDGRTLASVDASGVIEIWDLANARVVKTITAGTTVTALRFSPNGQLLAVAGADHVVTLWNLLTGQPQLTLAKRDAQVNALAFSPDGQLLASGGDDRKVVLWETASGKSRRTLKGHDQTVTSLAFSRDGRLLASGSGNASVVLWEVTTGKLNRILK
ncbi:MAG: WD40 repeat domain-containing protein [bacterium]